MPEFKLHEAFSGSEGGAGKEGAPEGDTDAERAAEYKKKGNEAFVAKNWDEAIKQYNKAIQIAPNEAAFYSNRAACWSSKGNHESALADSKRCLEADPTFIKGYSRKGKALFDMGKLDEAEEAYKEGLGLDDSNAGCVGGLRDVQTARAAKKASASASSSASSSSSMFGGLGGLGGAGGVAGMGRKLMETMKKGGMGGRMQMYVVVFVGYMMYNKFMGKGATGSSGSSSSAGGGDEDVDDPVAPPASAGSPEAFATGPRRLFAETDGSWSSYLEAGGPSSSVLLWLHRTPFSAAGEFGAAISKVTDRAAASPPTKGFRLLAPDRPCHGLSPCAAGAEKKRRSGPTGIDTWLQAFVSREVRKKKTKRLTVVASGRDGARQALALARDRSQPSSLLLVDPRASSPPSPPSTASSGAILEWMRQHVAEGASATVTADAARWASESSKAGASQEEPEDAAGLKKLEVASSGLPEGSKVTLLYTEGEKEDVDLLETLEGTGLAVRVRRAKGSVGAEALAAEMASEAWLLLVGEEDVTADI